MYSSSNFPLALYFIAISLLMHLPALPHSAAFQALQNHTVEARDWQLKELFGTTPDRFSRFSLEAAGLFLDYSKNRMDQNTMRLLCDLARERGVEPAREALFTGEKVNTTEHRAALHTALRMPRTQTLMVDGHSVDALARHFVAVSPNLGAIQSFGIAPENMFPFWDWVGGRYSVWSAIGLPVALAVGFEHFSAFLTGAHAMDLHFRNAPLERNM